MKQPNFFLRKPDTLSLLYRLDEKKDKQQLTVTMLAGFRLDPEPVLLDEDQAPANVPEGYLKLHLLHQG